MITNNFLVTTKDALALANEFFSWPFYFLR